MRQNTFFQWHLKYLGQSVIINNAIAVLSVGCQQLKNIILPFYHMEVANAPRNKIFL